MTFLAHFHAVDSELQPLGRNLRDFLKAARTSRAAAKVVSINPMGQPQRRITDWAGAFKIHAMVLSRGAEQKVRVTYLGAREFPGAEVTDMRRAFPFVGHHVPK